MSIPYTIQNSPNTLPISAKGLNNNFQYLDSQKMDKNDLDSIPLVPSEPSAVFVLASRGGFMFWMQTEECE